jgi:flagellar protein FlbT
MSGLTLTLRPRERFLVGGNLLENGPRRGSIRIVEDGAFVLRLSDALHPDDVRSPVTRAYHVAQLILACELAEEEGHPELCRRLEELADVFDATPHAETVARAREGAAERRYHRVLVALKALMPIEAQLLGLDDAASFDTEYSHEAARCIATGRR